MVRFLHTADWQIGMQAGHVGKAARKLRRCRLDAARRVVEVARGQDADFILVAGDTFEDNAVEGLLVQQVADILAAFGGPVYIIPGNHDLLAPGSVWEHPAWQEAGNICLLKEPVPLEAGSGVTLYPCPVTEKYCRADPTAWIEAAGNRRICIGLAHGSLEGVGADSDELPISRQAPGLRGLDYLALGHWHSTFLVEGPDGVARMAYCGTHETTRFGERDSGNVLMVQIEGRGEPPVIAPLRTGILTWEKVALTLRSNDDYRDLVRQVENRPAADRTLLWLVLEGLLAPEASIHLKRLEQLLEARFFYGRVDDGGLVPSPQDQEWIEALPAGYLQQAARKLLEQAAAGEQRRRQVARMALEELYMIAREVGA